MNILYCIHSLSNSGGMERVLSLKVNYLTKYYGYKITIITTEQKNRTPFYSIDSSITHIDLGINFNDDITLFQKVINRKKKLLKYKQKLIEIIEQNQIDICISLGWKEISFLQKLPNNVIKVCERHFAKNAEMLLAQSLYRNKLLSNIVGHYATNKLQNNTKKLDKLVVLTKEDEIEWKKTHNNIAQIYNPLPYELESVSSLASKRFITVGRLEAQKGYDLLIEAWKPIALSHPDWSVDIYGDGSLRSSLQKKIEDNNLTDKVRLKGISNNIDHEYKSSSGFIMSSRYEGFPMVLLEAAGFGLPLISFDCVSGPKEIIQNNYNGILIEFGNISKLSEAITRMIENENDRTIMGYNARKIAEEFTIDKIMIEWDNLFKSLKNKS